MSQEARVERFIERHTKLRGTPLLPELRLFVGGDPTKLWRETQDFVLRAGLGAERSMSPPYWAWPWAGGQAMARHLIDHAGLVRGKTVLDVASGGAVEGVAARLAGAARVVCVDVDPVAEHAARMNARANGVELEAMTGDATRADVSGVDVVLAGDIFYESRQSSTLLRWLRAQARRRLVLASDPGRIYAPRRGVRRLATYAVRTNLVLEGRLCKEAVVYRVLPDRARRPVL